MTLEDRFRARHVAIAAIAYSGSIETLDETDSRVRIVRSAVWRHDACLDWTSETTDDDIEIVVISIDGSTFRTVVTIIEDNDQEITEAVLVHIDGDRKAAQKWIRKLETARAT